MQFGGLQFEIKDGKIGLVGQGRAKTVGYGFSEVQLVGENKPTNQGGKTAKTSQGMKLGYLSHEEKENRLSIIQRAEKVEVQTTFEKSEGTKALRITQTVKNISEEEIILEEVSFSMKGLFGISNDEPQKVFFTKFYQSHHQECQSRRFSLFDYGFSRANDESQHRVAYANVGSQSTKEELPQGILEYEGQFCMFQIESNHSWLYEIGDYMAGFYLTLSTANYTQLNWAKRLQKGESYQAANVVLTFGDSLEEVLTDMNAYRRSLIPRSKEDEKQPIIFNEYMYFSWDSPEEERTKKLAPIARDYGADIYVVDCGWHNEEPGNIIYPYVGQWKESKARFPSGVRKTTDYIRSLGMKAGLWIEPEIVGMLCDEMIAYYGDECFVQRFGKPIIVGRRRFLDFRKEKVRAYMTESIRRMIEEYGADYIKFDYNQDMGVGSEMNATSAGEGLELVLAAYLEWVDEIRQKFPQIIFENCASGGCRLDYSSLSHFELASTSDCSSYELYPYISANLISAIVPRQAGVWCYPVANLTSDKEISLDRVTTNVVNTLLGRMHLASNLALLNEEQGKLLKEGIALHKQLKEVREKGNPFLPLGLAKRGDKVLASGLRLGEEAYLCVWNLDKQKTLRMQLGERYSKAEVLYPSKRGIEATLSAEEMTITFEEVRMAAFIRLTGRSLK